ncbi:VOC family protein [Deinococcus deserti]|uniref:VOC family protein n=1 Tax=Deinococcus deserti TaxID=310783 RepID=UPI0013923D92|nr:VOC family protein [Deinococcus deserti]
MLTFSGGRIGVVVQTDDAAEVDEVVRRVGDARYHVITEPFDAPWGQRCASGDPDGTHVDVLAWRPH